MLKDIAPGSKITVKILRTPSNAAAAKTLVRLLSKDPKVKIENERLRKSRASGHTTHQRGGRQWNVFVPKQRPIEGVRGEEQTITASVDVLTDLKSVEKWVEVTKV